MQRVINFSGGKTSAYMTIMEYKQGDIVLFCDTGREHPKTYKFIHDFEAYENIPVIWLKYEGGFERLLKERKAIPNRFKKFCTVELKVKTARRYLRTLGIMKYENFIGFRGGDEKDRIRNYKSKWKQVVTVFPLRHATKQSINNYWKTKPYTLEIPSILGNCTLCFQKGKNAITAILREEPELADPWIADEENNPKGNTYFHGITIRQLRSIAQNNLFKDYNLNEIQPAYNCSCTA